MVQRPPKKFGISQSISGQGTSGAPFAQSAYELLRAGMVPIPCEHKRPLLKGWQKLTSSAVTKKLPGLIARFGDANVGIACGASHIVVVDIDAPPLLDEMVQRFGSTPLVIRSPSGGLHLYYRAGPTVVGCRNLRQNEGLAVDIKGRGGLVIAPPSRNPSSDDSYYFDQGSWDCLPELPLFPAGLLPESSDRSAARDQLQTSRIRRGERNNSLFRELLQIAPHCDDFEALLDVAHSRNDHLFKAPLPASEIVATARSVWRYEMEDRNWVGKSPRIVLTRDEILIFATHKNGGDALILWAYLTGVHARRKEALVLDREAMARDGVLPGWKAWRYRQAIKTLVRDLELLVLVEKGQRRADKTLMPNRYLLRQPLAGSRQYATQTVSQRGTGSEMRNSAKRKLDGER